MTQTDTTRCRHCQRSITPSQFGSWQDESSFEVCDPEDGPSHEPEAAWIKRADGTVQTFDTRNKWVDALFMLGITNPGANGYLTNCDGSTVRWGAATTPDPVRDFIDRHGVIRHVAMLDELYQADVLSKAAWLRSRRNLTDSLTPEDQARLNTSQTERLEDLRGEIRAERISYGEIAELQDLVGYIDPSDGELLAWAGGLDTDNDAV